MALMWSAGGSLHTSELHKHSYHTRSNSPGVSAPLETDVKDF